MTAIEFMHFGMLEILGDDIVNNLTLEKIMSIHSLTEQAKEMEKKQHNETWDSAHQAGRFEGKGIAEENWQTFESHWDKTFKSE